MRSWSQEENLLNYVKEYYKQITTEKVVACDEIKGIYSRMVKEMDLSEKMIRFLFGFLKKLDNMLLILLRTIADIIKETTQGRELN